MTALLDAFARWGPSAVGGAAVATALVLVLAGFGLGVAHGTVSAVTYSGTAGVAILLVAIVFRAVRAGDV